MNQRQLNILNQVNTLGHVSVSDLAQLIGVSEVTIRADLTFLEKQGLLNRIHGAAIRINVDDVDRRMKLNFAQKQQLAHYAASLVEDGETIFIETGSTNALLARQLAETKQITIVTISSYIARLLKETATEVILLGGLYQKGSERTVGPLTRICIQHIHFSKAFLGIDGFRPETGFTGRDMMRADVLNTILAKNAENIIVTDSSKFGQVYSNALNPIENINRLITDKPLNPQDKEALLQHNIIIDVVENDVVENQG